MEAKAKNEHARLAKKKYELRFIKVSVRYSTEEHELIKGFAETAGKQVATFIHDISLDPRFKIVPAPPQINIQTRAEIQKIGVNINQIARALNNQFAPNNSEKIRSELASIVQILKLIQESL